MYSLANSVMSTVNRWMVGLFFCTLCVLPPFSCFAESGSSGDEITGGFRFVSPAEKGESRWKVEGDHAKFLSEEVIEISPVRATIHHSEENPYIIHAPWARLNKTTKDVWTDSAIEILQGNSKLTGVGLKWESARKEIKILSHVKMILYLDEVSKLN